MRTSTRGNERERGSVLMDALVSLMILATLGLLVLGLLSLSYQRLRGLEAEVRSCLDEYASTISTE